MLQQGGVFPRKCVRNKSKEGGLLVVVTILGDLGTQNLLIKVPKLSTVISMKVPAYR